MYKALYLTSSPTGNYREGPPTDFIGLNPANDFVKELKKDIRVNSRCLYVTATPDDIEASEEAARFFTKAFRDTGFMIMDFESCDNSNVNLKLDHIHEYQLIIFGGGHVPTQNRFLIESGIPEKLKDFFGVIIGISAGSMNSAELVYIQPEEAGESINPNFIRYSEGLGLTDINLIPHYQAVKNDILDGKRLYEDITYQDSIGHEFYCLCDSSYLLQRKGIKEIRGEAYLIKDGSITKINEKEEVYSFKVSI